MNYDENNNIINDFSDDIETINWEEPNFNSVNNTSNFSQEDINNIQNQILTPFESEIKTVQPYDINNEPMNNYNNEINQNVLSNNSSYQDYEQPVSQQENIQSFVSDFQNETNSTDMFNMNNSVNSFDNNYNSQVDFSEPVQPYTENIQMSNTSVDSTISQEYVQTNMTNTFNNVENTNQNSYNYMDATNNINDNIPQNTETLENTTYINPVLDNQNNTVENMNVDYVQQVESKSYTNNEDSGKSGYIFMIILFVLLLGFIIALPYITKLF